MGALLFWRTSKSLLPGFAYFSWKMKICDLSLPFWYRRWRWRRVRFRDLVQKLCCYRSCRGQFSILTRDFSTSRLPHLRLGESIFERRQSSSSHRWQQRILKRRSQSRRKGRIFGTVSFWRGQGNMRDGELVFGRWKRGVLKFRD